MKFRVAFLCLLAAPVMSFADDLNVAGRYVLVQGEPEFCEAEYTIADEAALNSGSLFATRFLEVMPVFAYGGHYVYSGSEPSGGGPNYLIDVKLTYGAGLAVTGFSLDVSAEADWGDLCKEARYERVAD